MSNNNENKLVPKLRFPEFKNHVVWEDKKFDDLCMFIRGPFGGALKKEIFVREGYAVYEQSHAIYEDFTTFRYFISEGKFNELKRFSILPNDIIMSCSGTMGKFAIIPEKSKAGVINQALLKLTVKSGYEVGFIKTTLELPVNQNKLLSQSAGGAIKNVVEVAQIKEIKLLIPSIKEQQKIAECLSSLDEVITAESQKLELLKDHKKGLLQNLFPQEGETVPRFRFKEFEDSGEWEEKKLDEICDINPKISQLPNQFVYIDLESVEKGSLLKKRIIEKEGAPSRAQRLLKNDDIIFQTVRPYQKNNYYFRKEDNFDYVASTGYAQLRAFESSSFLFQLIHTDGFVANILEKCSGSNYPAINSSDLLKIEVELPPTKTEQQKIADTLSSVDELISAQSQKVEAIKLHKKGLLQGLFPEVTEVTEVN